MLEVKIEYVNDIFDDLTSKVKWLGMDRATAEAIRADVLKLHGLEEPSDDEV